MIQFCLLQVQVIVALRLTALLQSRTRATVAEGLTAEHPLEKQLIGLFCPQRVQIRTSTTDMYAVQDAGVGVPQQGGGLVRAHVLIPHPPSII